jgi:hypothetical protein
MASAVHAARLDEIRVWGFQIPIAVPNLRRNPPLKFTVAHSVAATANLEQP